MEPLPAARGPCKGGRYTAGCRCDLCKARNREYKRRGNIGRRARRETADFKHGISGYVNHGCRCDVCGQAQSERNARGAHRRKERANAGDGAVPHGTRSGYTGWGCRCDNCRKAAGHNTARPPAPEHGTPWRYDQGCRCADCKEAKRTYTSRWLDAHPGKAAEYRRRSLTPERARQYRRAQKTRLDAIADRATRRGYEWTGPELEIASRADLSHSEVALMLKRTYAGVVEKRKQLRVDPRAAALAGIERPRAKSTRIGPEVNRAIDELSAAVVRE